MDVDKYDEFYRSKPEQEVVTVETKIKSSNIGFSMLAKMGWVEGSPLGLSGDGAHPSLTVAWLLIHPSMSRSCRPYTLLCEERPHWLGQGQSGRSHECVLTLLFVLLF